MKRLTLVLVMVLFVVVSFAPIAFFGCKKEKEIVPVEPLKELSPKVEGIPIEGVPVEQGLFGLKVEDCELQYSLTGNAIGIVGTVVNKSDIEFSYVHVDFNLYDESGSQIGTTSDYIDNLEPHGRWRFEASIDIDYVKDVARVKFKGVEGRLVK